MERVLRHGFVSHPIHVLHDSWAFGIAWTCDILLVYHAMLELAWTRYPLLCSTFHPYLKGTVFAYVKFRERFYLRWHHLVMHQLKCFLCLKGTFLLIICISLSFALGGLVLWLEDLRKFPIDTRSDLCFGDTRIRFCNTWLLLPWHWVYKISWLGRNDLRICSAQRTVCFECPQNFGGRQISYLSTAGKPADKRVLRWHDFVGTQRHLHFCISNVSSVLDRNHFLNLAKFWHHQLIFACRPYIIPHTLQESIDRFLAWSFHYVPTWALLLLFWCLWHERSFCPSCSSCVSAFKEVHEKPIMGRYIVGRRFYINPAIAIFSRVSKA